MKTKKILSVVLAAVMLVLTLSVGLMPLAAFAADDAFIGEDYYLKLLNPDILPFQGSELLQWGYAPNLTYYPNFTNIYLARNEREASQVYFYEKGEGRDLRLEVTPYVNDAGEVLPHEVFNERFFTITNVWDKPVAEALVPYGGEAVRVDAQKCAAFYVEVRSAADQTPGVYTSTYTLYNGSETVRTFDVTATVWNFTLPETHYSTLVGGLYNSNSGYGATKGFLEMSGIRFSGGNPVEEDKAEAERILEGWQEFLLDHGVSTYEIPRWLIDADEKAAQLTLADPRRKAAAVPLYKSGSTVTATGRTVIAKYRELIGDSEYLADKMYFYPADEPGWASDADAAVTTALVENIRALWPDAHTVIPINQIGLYDYQGPKIKELTDIFCPNNHMLNGHQNVYDDFTDGTWHRTWRYLCNDHTGCIASLRWGKLPMGVCLRAPYWQAEVLGSDGLLNWNIGFVPYQNGEPYDIWGTESVYPKMGGAGINGEAIIVYESKSLGLDPATPIASLRLKSINNSLDDYDYLELAKEAFGTGADSPYTRALNKVFQYYSSKGSKYIFSCETSAWPDGGNYEWVGHHGMDFVNARLILGNALSEAWTEDEEMHDYGEWQTVVTPDESHNGLAIRICTACGAEESKKLYLCDDGSHDDSVYTPVDESTHSVACAICGRTRTEAHTPVETAGKAPTCTEDGYTAGMICEKCGAVLEGTEILPAAHTLTATAAVAPGCETPGNIAYWYCGVCQKYFADEACTVEITLSDTVRAATGHRWDNGAVTAPATCKAEGKRVYTCLNGCGETREETIAKTSAHTWDGGTVTAQPTCTADGVKTFTCTVCGAKKTEAVQKLGHTAANANGKCERCGAQLVSGCKYCGEVHTGFFGKIVGFFHNIAYFFKNLF